MKRVDTLLNAINEGRGLDCVLVVAVEQGHVGDIVIETLLDAVSHFERKRCDEPRSRRTACVEAVMKLFRNAA